MMYGVITLYEMSLLYHQMTKNSAVIRILASVINNWNKVSKYLWTIKVIYIFSWPNKLLIWFEIKISDNCFNFIGDRFLRSIFLVVLGFFSTTHQHFQLLNTLKIYLSYKKYFEFTLCRIRGFIFILSWWKII